MYKIGLNSNVSYNVATMLKIIMIMKDFPAAVHGADHNLAHLWFGEVSVESFGTCENLPAC